jgi:hypothetical protein
MAEVKNIKINVDTKQATQAMDDLAKATHDVSASFEEVYGDLQPLTTRMGEAEDRLYELANAGQTATKEYQDLLTTVGNYRKVQIQTDMAVDAAASTMSQKLGGALGGATAGFQLVQGAMGAFGAESAQVEQALLKVQSAMAIADGVRGFREAIPSIKAFGSAMKTAIGSTGIGLLVVALGTLAAYWDDIKAAVSGVSAEQSKLNQKTDANVLAQQAKYDAISGQDNILKLQGKSERDILRIKQTQIQAVIKATEAQLVQQEATKKAQVMAARRNQEILTGILTFLTAPLQLLLGTVDMVGKALGKDFNLRQGLNKSITSLVFDPEETAEEGDKVINETKAKLAQLKNEAAGFTLALKEMNKPAEDVVTKSSDKVVKDADKVVEEVKKEVETLEVFKLDSVRAISSQIQEERRKELEAEMANSLEKRRIAKEEADAIIALEAEKKKAREDALTATASTLGQIADLFGQQTAAGKAAAIAEATIQTYLSAQKAYQSTVGIPIVGPVLAPINAGLAIAAGIKNIKAITAVKTPSNGGGGGGGNLSNSFTSGAQAPSFNVVGNSGMNQLAQIQQTPVQAYVVSGEVTSAQALDRNRVKNATL